MMFFLLVILFDIIFGDVLRNCYFKSSFGVNYHLTYSLEVTKADVIIIGSSRALGHYVPDILEDSLRLTCFNTGADGNFFWNNYAVFLSIINRYNPKIIIYDLNLVELYSSNKDNDELSSLLPYYKSNPEIRHIIDLKRKDLKFKMISHIYPFNSSLIMIAQGCVKTEKINEMNGYKPLFGNLIDTTPKKFPEPIAELDRSKLCVIDSICLECKLRNINLVFIQSPRFNTYGQNMANEAMKEIAINHDISFWDYINDTTFFNQEYFKDGAHLNDNGAREFTRVIARSLKQKYLEYSVIQ